MLGPSRWLPQSGANPAVLALARLPAPPGIVPGFPWALPGGAAAASFDGPEAAHPADGPPAPSGTKGKAHDQHSLGDTLRPRTWSS